MSGARAGRAIYYSIHSPWTRATGLHPSPAESVSLANEWRTGPDIHTSRFYTCSWERILNRTHNNNKYAHLAGPGGWNTPDMLMVGNPGLSDAEGRSTFSLWCIMKSPLMIGTDITKHAPHSSTMRTLGNIHAIAVDQDPVGVQGTLRKTVAATWELWAGPLNGGCFAGLLLNLQNSPASVSVSIGWEDLGITSRAERMDVFDLWSDGKIIHYGAVGGTNFTAASGHDCAFYRLCPAKLADDANSRRQLKASEHEARLKTTDGAASPSRSAVYAGCLSAPRLKTEDAAAQPIGFVSQIFQHGEAGCACIGIPAVVRTNGSTLLAFAECRAWTSGDGCYPVPVKKECGTCNCNRSLPESSVCIVVKRSDSAGRHWSDMHVIAVGRNLMPAWDQLKSRLVLNFELGNIKQPPIISQATSTQAIIANTDGAAILTAGAWSASRSIFTWPGWASHPGPNAGVQLMNDVHGHRGRLVFAGWADSTDSKGKGGNTCVVLVWFSDDSGASFRKGATLPGACEVGLTELADGRLLILGNDDDRFDGGPCPADRLAHAFSSDGGQSFAAWQCDDALINSGSEASVLASEGNIFVSNPGINPVTCP